MSKDKKQIKALKKLVRQMGLDYHNMTREAARALNDADIEKHNLEERTKSVVTSVYRERDQLVAALSKLFRAHLRRDPAGEEGFQNTVCIHLPNGQATWHIADIELNLFDHLMSYAATHGADDTCEYDGHNTYVKYERLNALAPPVLAEVSKVPRDHYFSKVQEVEACPWTGRNVAAVKKFGGDKVKVEAGNGLMLLAGKDGAQNWVPVPVNHWLVCSAGDKSDIWPVEAEYFANKYEP